MARINATIPPQERDSSRVLVTLAVVVAALYFGSEIFVPIALAILLSFILAPGVRKLHAWGLGRVFPVALVTLLAFSVIFGLGIVLASQLKGLANDLPRYEGTITRKITALRNLSSNGAFQRIEESIGKLSRVAGRAVPAEPATRQDNAPAPRQAEAVGSEASNQPPVPVEIRQPQPTPIETIMSLASPLIHPLATAGIVVIFVLFILLQREDLRNRLIRLFGANDLQRSTAAIDDGAKRLSRYLITQSLLNMILGSIVGAAAFFVGIPNPILWGILFALLRFVPYIGPIIGGALPVLFAAAVDSGWSTALWMAGIVLATELVVGQMLEPILYGHNTGLSPVAIVASATFWTALWGPVGLLLATPMTVCLVVLGRHVEPLNFINVLLGDQPPLTAPETFYQRMLANDATEVSDLAEDFLKTMTLAQYYDEVMLPGLLLAQCDVTAERLSVERQYQIRDATSDVIEDLEHASEAAYARKGRWHLFQRPHDKEADAAEIATPVITPNWQRDGAILCIGARGPLDDCSAAMLAHGLVKRGLGAKAESFTSLSKASIDALDTDNTRLICLSCLDGSSTDYVRFAIRRVRRRAPRAKILIGAWWLQLQDPALEQPHVLDDEQSITEPLASTLIDAIRYCLAAASALAGDELTHSPDAPTPDAVDRAS